MLALDKQLGKRLVAQVPARRCQYNLAERCDANASRLRTVVCQRHPPDLDILVRHHCDLHMKQDPVVAPPQFGRMRMKYDLFVLAAHPSRLAPGRPGRPAVKITHIQPSAPIVTSRVGAPACKHHAAALAEAAPRIGDEGAEMTV